MNRLYRGHEQHYIHIAVHDGQHGLTQRRKIERQSPLVDRHLDHGLGAHREFGNQFRIGSAVLLHRDPHTGKLRAEGPINHLDHLAPGTRLAGHRSDRHGEVAQRCLRFHAAHHNLGAAQCRKNRLSVVVRGDDVHHGPDADAGQEEQQIEPAGQQVRRELQAGCVRFERYLAHGGHNKWLTVVGADQPFNLPGPARLQRENAQPVETCVWHKLLGQGKKCADRPHAKKSGVFLSNIFHFELELLVTTLHVCASVRHCCSGFFARHNFPAEIGVGNSLVESLRSRSLACRRKLTCGRAALALCSSFPDSSMPRLHACLSFPAP
jgi:hypothetical protein